MKKVDASVPRKMFWSSDVGGTSHCPECRSPLENEMHSYLVFARGGHDTEHFMMGSDGGYFCTQCPVVVLDREEFGQLASMGLNQSGRIEMAEAGIIDLEAVPESKRSRPFGGEDSPIPLVPFTNVPAPQGDRRQIHRSRRKRKHRKGRKRRK